MILLDRMVYFEIKILFLLNGVFAESFQELHPFSNDVDQINMLKYNDPNSLSHVSNLKPEGKISVWMIAA